MSIASEISRLQGAKSSIKTAIENKGVTVPSDLKLQGYGSCIDAIQTWGDYSCWSVAYWLQSSSVTLPSCTSTCWLVIWHSERAKDWTAIWIFNMNSYDRTSSTHWIYTLIKKAWVDSQWSCVYWQASDWNTSSKICFFKNTNNNDCYLIDTYHYSYFWWKWTAWNWKECYKRLWVDFSIPCVSCIWEWYICYRCAWSHDECCNSNPQWDDYSYVWGCFSCLSKCRWNPKASIKCWVITCVCNCNFRSAAIFC